METCVFCKIRDREIPKVFSYEDNEIMVFPDINPVRPVHLLIVPKEHFSELTAVYDGKLWGKFFSVIQKMIKEQKLENRGYRVTVNGGGAQLIDHLHLHLSGPIKKKEVF